MKTIFLTNKNTAPKIDREYLSIDRLARSVLFKVLNDTDIYKDYVKEESIDKFLKRERVVSKIPKKLFWYLQSKIAEEEITTSVSCSKLIQLTIEVGNDINKYFWIKQIIEKIESSTRFNIAITDVNRLTDYKKLIKYTKNKNMKVIVVIDELSEELKDIEIDIKVTK